METAYQRLPYTASLHSVSVCVTEDRLPILTWLRGYTRRRCLSAGCLSRIGFRRVVVAAVERRIGEGEKGGGKNGATCIRCGTIMAEREGGA